MVAHGLIPGHSKQVNGKNVSHTNADALKELFQKVMLPQSSVSHFQCTANVHTVKGERPDRK